MKIIIFNSPPNAGKDEAVRHLVRYYGVFPFSFKNRLKRIVLEVYGIDEATWDSWYTREGKEIPRSELDGRSCREAFIHMSEQVIKPAFGKDYFGRAEARKIKQASTNMVLAAACSDGGFNEEVNPLVDAFGAENVHIIRIERPGCSFAGDSRSWITTDAVPDENYQTIYNDGTLDEYWENLDDAYNYIMSK